MAVGIGASFSKKIHFADFLGVFFNFWFLDDGSCDLFFVAEVGVDAFGAEFD
ncbi:hypothetical protein ADIARSV_2868 [Arcticibacter svalbardensis MN12-7]|uniref:Uncharacterized protein n=1 Tax=Arcticibacter svalbardensis MN12-7 TaxID=1150600 RepID=R9GYH5_9SPHI|nr:hypothetical protein ADIARSV_2868 [Arcticibacter svalbardensis MN12-7]